VIFASKGKTTKVASIMELDLPEDGLKSISHTYLKSLVHSQSGKGGSLSSELACGYSGKKPMGNFVVTELFNDTKLASYAADCIENGVGWWGYVLFLNNEVVEVKAKGKVYLFS
jgi:hypothetical protein